jgi:hypothetical protein
VRKREEEKKEAVFHLPFSPAPFTSLSLLSQISPRPLSTREKERNQNYDQDHDARRSKKEEKTNKTILDGNVLSCDVFVSCLVLSCSFLSCLVMLWLALSYLFLYCLVLCCLALSCLALPCVDKTITRRQAKRGRVAGWV